MSTVGNLEKWPISKVRSKKRREKRSKIKKLIEFLTRAKKFRQTKPIKKLLSANQLGLAV